MVLRLQLSKLGNPWSLFASFALVLVSSASAANAQDHASGERHETRDWATQIENALDDSPPEAPPPPVVSRRPRPPVAAPATVAPVPAPPVVTRVPAPAPGAAASAGAARLEVSVAVASTPPAVATPTSAAVRQSPRPVRAPTVTATIAARPHVAPAPEVEPAATRGALQWATHQPQPAWAASTVFVSRWHAFVGMNAGYGRALAADVFGLQYAGATDTDPGFSGVLGGLDVGLADGSWDFGVSVPLLFVPGGGADAPEIGSASFGGAEARVGYTLDLGGHIGLGAQLGGGFTLAFVDAAVDRQLVAHRLSPYAIPTADAALKMSERVMGHLFLEQSAGVRVLVSEFVDGFLPLLTVQAGVRYVF